jgi:hypothetical protein
MYSPTISFRADEMADFAAWQNEVQPSPIPIRKDGKLAGSRRREKGAESPGTATSDDSPA